MCYDMCPTLPDRLQVHRVGLSHMHPCQVALKTSVECQPSLRSHATLSQRVTHKRVIVDSVTSIQGLQGSQVNGGTARLAYEFQKVLKSEQTTTALSQLLTCASLTTSICATPGKGLSLTSTSAVPRMLILCAWTAPG